MNKNPIGIIDSGIGGLSIIPSLIKQFPNEKIFYLADSKNCPYGNKSSWEIYDLSKSMIEFLLQKQIKILIVACNTITVTSINKLRKTYPNLPIVGIVPVIKTAAKKSRNKNIGIFSTKVTAKSKYQKDLVNKFAKGFKVVNIGSTELVPLIESLDFEDMIQVLNKELAVFKKSQIDVLALGCSHFPLVKKEIQKIIPNILILDSADAVSRQVERILIHNKILSNFNKPSYNFYTTGDVKALKYYVKKLTNRGKIERISLQ